MDFTNLLDLSQAVRQEGVEHVCKTIAPPLYHLAAQDLTPMLLRRVCLVGMPRTCTSSADDQRGSGPLKVGILCP